MIIAGGKFTGKRLVNNIVQNLKKNRYVDVAVLSEAGYKRANKAAQEVANKFKCRINADPSHGEIQVDRNTYKSALILKLTVVEAVKKNG